MRVSGCKNHYQFVLGVGAKAKSVTNNLPILSVLAFRALFLSVYLLSRQALWLVLVMYQLERSANVLDYQSGHTMTRPKKSLHFLLLSPISNLHFILNPKYCLLF